MLWGFIVLLFILWILGYLVLHLFGALIHLLLLIAAIVLIVRLIQGKRVL